MNVSKNSAARAIADVERGVLLATIDIAASPERVFRAVTSEEVARWWGFGVTRYSGDIRVGGAWRTDGVGDNGKPFEVHGEFLQVEPPHKLVQTVHHWNPPPGLGVTTITWHFESIPGGTHMIVRHEGFGDAQASCADHAGAWEPTLNHLSEHVAAKT